MRTQRKVVPTAVDGPLALALLREYTDEMVSRYHGRAATGSEVDAAIAEDPNDGLHPPEGVFLVAFDGPDAVGCVGVRELTPGVAELKRMYVVPRSHGRGWGGALLDEVEQRTTALGYHAIRLDTRSDLVEARGLYATRGYVEIPAYNDAPYASHWFEKTLWRGRVVGNAFDAVTIEDLRARGSLKWTLHGDAIGAFIAEMDFGTAPPVLEALHVGVDSLHLGYQPPRLFAELSQACADYQLAQHGWRVSPERVHAIPDVIRALTLTIEHFSAPGGKVILPTPAYMPFLKVPGGMGRELITVPMVVDQDRPALDLDALDAAFKAGGDLLVLCNPHNPLGRVFTPEELTAVCEVVDRNGGRVFSDEINAPLVHPGHRHVPYASLSDTAAGHTITATSASKAWNLPGLKCAQLIISDEADAATLRSLGEHVTEGASNLGVIANTAAYVSGRPWLEEVLDYLDGNRHAVRSSLAEHLPEVGYRIPEGTYLAWLDFRALDLGDHPGEFFHEKAGVVLTDGPACGEEGRGHARLNFATPRPILEHIIATLAKAVRNR
ncbi:aminotransferase class I/II-fold pyridoxal phosphate-dependent enzyme [Saccharopolyspora tripterygii]